MEYKSWKIIIQKITNFEIKKGLTTFVNPYSMLLLKERNDIAEEIDHWYVDGISLVNKLNKYYKLKNNRFSFDDTSLAPIIFNHSRINNLSIAIIGTKEEYINKAVNAIEGKYNVKIAYARNGYFKDYEKEDCINLLVKEKLDVVICGMGAPYQEIFLIDLKNAGWSGYGYTCGGYLHQIAKKKNYYPTFFDKLNIRWIYRIIDEPKLFQRYLIDYPDFFLKFHKFRKIYKSN
ncbi:WecB/TagA/CpsF family glycosyltransferase [Flavobacterium sp. MC2016-06]|jgi:exopolysaccharide biosynthesis WecB/TagA/CpsF family protein|uniref:WecB/TagA/CpsF family glycosyltransferase n=1 Tax=Flavobacterium sp. MC2016-06 TaxID=2676308 RepID=UPI0012BA9BE9|nr:WecB/TagA/CpsF family glycosyltransferase [Flavobacterium sp. MC2016-06]MBU3862044.1 WecB/TagA/CpsF family glycosyltransferase [Flavobacterium sp. MC2016-06]